MKTKTSLDTAPSGSGAVSEKPASIDLPRIPAKSFKLKRILVPIDFSEGSLRALDYAVAMAQSLRATVIALHVVEPAVHAGSYLSAPVGLDPATQNLLEAAREKLGAISQKHSQGLPVESLVRMGHPASEIADTAKAMAVDWIVLAMHSQAGASHPAMGSTAERVVRTAGCPVLTVPPVPGRSSLAGA